MKLQIMVAIFMIIATWLSVYFLKKYGFTEKFSYLQMSLSLGAVYFSESVGIWWGIGCIIYLGISLTSTDILKELSEDVDFQFITTIFGNLAFVIDNIYNIVNGVFKLIILLVIILSIVIMIWIILGYIYLIIKYIITKYKF